MKNTESVGHLISCLHRHAHVYFDKKMSKFELGSGTFIFLLPLYHHDGINQNELTKKLHFDKATTTRAIQKLLDLKYIKREKDEKDNRAYKLHITPKAEEIKPEIIKFLQSWTQILTEGFSVEEKKITIKLLNRMVKNSLDHKNNHINCQCESKNNKSTKP